MSWKKARDAAGMVAWVVLATMAYQLGIAPETWRD